MPTPKGNAQAACDLEKAGRLWRYLTNPEDHPIDLDGPESLACAEALRRAARTVVGVWLEASSRG